MTLDELLKAAKAKGFTKRKLALKIGNAMFFSALYQRKKKTGDPFSAGQRQLLSAIEAVGGRIVFDNIKQ